MKRSATPGRRWAFPIPIFSGESGCPAAAREFLAGTVLAFARALGEYGATSMIAGYTPGKTATISTTVYQLWRTGDDALAFRWVLVNVAISAVVLLAVNLLERKHPDGGKMEAAGMSLRVEIEKRLGNFALQAEFETREQTLALLGASGCARA